MALTILRSNRVETLQLMLTRQLADAPLADPFATEVVVVPTYAMARWLNLRIARQQGIAANIQYPQVGEWIWSLARVVLEAAPQQDPCSRDALGWWIFDALPGLLGEAAFTPLRRYLDDDHDAIKRWQLSQRIANSFDRYQTWRPEVIRAWSDGADEQWQAHLWRSIVTANKRLHRVDIMRDMVVRLGVARLGDEHLVSPLPARISLFALSRLAPCHVELVHALARHTEVLLFQHNPTDQYWADLVSEKEQARKRLQNPDHDQYFDSGNHLLTSWGGQGQAMQDLLIGLDPVTAREVEDNQPPAGGNLLHSLQASLFHLEQPRLAATIDDSVSVHLCHSPMRECQVLHDQLLTLLARHDDLASEDILVMVPEISRYAPYIEAVFQHDASNKRPNLAWNISDISVRDGHPLVRVFLQLLNLPGSRFPRSEILSFLECREIRQHFALDQPMIDDIHHLIESARVRWGINAGQRRALGLPAIHENTWQQAWERLFAGYAMPGSDLWQQIAPIDEVDRDSGVAIARFRYLFERLVYWQERLGRAASANAWQLRLHQLVDEFLAPANASDDLLQPLRNAISELGQSESRELSPTMVVYWMEKQLSTNQQPGRLYSGGITFCGMQPLRNIPFAVICVLGMQDNAFPRREQAAEFDLMRDSWRAGDPHRGDEDRYLMLETLLCARQYLYFSYCGRSLKDNSECQPSVLLRELLDYIDSCVVAQPGQASPSEQISRLHPMQAFSAKNFHAQTPGYDQYWYDTALLLQAPRTQQPKSGWVRQALVSPARDPERNNYIDLAQLSRFFQHPLRFFYQSRLGIRIPALQASEDEEVFALQGLQKWMIAERLARQTVAGEAIDRLQYSARGLLPHGRAAASEWYAVLSEYQGLLERLDVFHDRPSETRTVECRIDDGLLLCGEVDQCYPGMGLMHFSASKSIKSRALISLWLNHLTLAASGLLAAQESSQLFIAGATGKRFAWMDEASAKSLLSGYIELFRQGLEYPLPVFPETSYSWALAWARASADDAETAMRKALTVWNGASYSGGARAEREDEFIRLALHNNIGNPLDDALFQQCAQQIYLPPIEQGSEID